ncbi:MAG: phytanoyl-CoA dioxygenase family protein [Betaproteobacteria bacterium]|nr:phytanoyl-CoA dioxygenase family protein [Betaproteobacteria bacterium]MDA9295636.1 phytanoyl-CoA dioxygenase family protein [Burkholderiales bacterium]MBT5670035.1 phytanoyl-CoA dioxygenase family protein [Betaproteobacteria bacterium]MBT6184346.1 phytanoyl-CoA dioxygenase family protein [Betaproteobacteria bacterium]MBT6530360.1 phytanoyl-CoA dioxygenase family protein [Betaproteobacteria bacterium]
MLSKEQVDQYHSEGYVVARSLIDEVALDQLRELVSEMLVGAEELTEHNEKFDLEPSHKASEPKVRRIKTPHKWHSFFWDLIRSPRLVSCLTDLLGSDVRLHGSKLNLKSSQEGSAVEWHQDWAFYPHSNDHVLAVGLMMDDMTLDNGPLLVVPGSHRVNKVWNHHQDGYFCGAIPASQNRDLDFEGAIPCLGKAGDCSFHHVRLVHGSAQNTSQSPRRLMLYECAAADAWPYLKFSDLEEFNGRMIVGEPTLEPRSTDVPIRMPFPEAKRQGSIYENQTSAADRFFT